LIDSRGQGVLLTAEAGDEASAANQAAVFEPPQGPLEQLMLRGDHLA